MERAKILTVGADRLLLSNFARRIESEPRMTSAGFFTDAKEALASARLASPDIAVVCGDLPENGSFAFADEIKKDLPHCKVLLFLTSRLQGAVSLAAATRADVITFLPRDLAEFTETLYSVMEGERPAPVDYASVAAVLMELGFDPKAQGFGFLIKMITAASEKDEKVGLCDLYREAAASFSELSGSAEATARLAVKNAYEASPEAFLKLGFKSRPSLGSFIYRIIREAR